MRLPPWWNARWISDLPATDARVRNWQPLGLTTGRGKNDHTNKPNRPIKEVLGLPLARRFREYLSQG